jgi:hypothetical protein
LQLKYKYFILLIILVSSSCKKYEKEGCTDIVSINYDPEAKINNGSCEYGGEGGQRSINILAVSFYPHIRITEIPDTAYIKYNAIEKPDGDAAAYDKIIYSSPDSDTLYLTGMKSGNYYIYVATHDSIYGRLTHGGPFSIRHYHNGTHVNWVVGQHCCVF